MCGLISGSTLSGAQGVRGAGVAGPFRRGGRCVFVISGRRANLMAITDAGGIMPPKIDLVRTQAARRSVVAFGLTPLRSEVETRDRRLIEDCHADNDACIQLLREAAVLPVPVTEQAQRDLVALQVWECR